jgi:YggT family protein
VGLRRVREPLPLTIPSGYSSARCTDRGVELLRMNPFLWLLDTIINIYIWLLIASAVLSWLIAFNVVNTRNPIVHSVGDFLYRVTEPLLRPIRNMLPSLGGIDVSPVILIIGLLFLERFIFWAYYRLAI